MTCLKMNYQCIVMPEKNIWVIVKWPKNKTETLEKKNK